MNKRNGFFMLFALSAMFLMVLVMPNNIFASTKISSATDEEKDRKVVDFVSDEKIFFDLKSSDFEVELVRELYHTDDLVLAYYYQVKEQGELKGFVLASAQGNIDFILEYGQFAENVDTKYAELLSKNLNEKAYFLGLDFILFADNKTELTKVFEQKKDEAIESAVENGESNEYIQEIKDAEPGVDIEGMEYALKSNSNSISSDSRVADEYHLSVTRLWQEDPNVAHPGSACGPTSGAMIANYYGQVRGFDVRTTQNYSNVGTFINHLYFEMNSYALGTNSYSFLNGLSVHLNHDASQWEGVRNGEPTFANVINAINKHYPVAYVTRFGNEDYHWRVIKGYKQSTGMVFYKDPGGSKSNYADLVATWSLIQNGITTVYFR